MRAARVEALNRKKIEAEAEAEAELEVELEAEADTNSEKSNSSSNTGIGSSNSKSNYVENKILKRLDENENKMIGNKVGYDREKRLTQQQKYEKSMPIANRTPNDDSNGENNTNDKNEI